MPCPGSRVTPHPQIGRLNGPVIAFRVVQQANDRRNRRSRRPSLRRVQAANVGPRPAVAFLDRRQGDRASRAAAYSSGRQRGGDRGDTGRTGRLSMRSMRVSATRRPGFARSSTFWGLSSRCGRWHRSFVGENAMRHETTTTQGVYEPTGIDGTSRLLPVGSKRHHRYRSSPTAPARCWSRRRHRSAPA